MKKINLLSAAQTARPVAASQPAPIDPSLLGQIAGGVKPVALGKPPAW